MCILLAITTRFLEEALSLDSQPRSPRKLRTKFVADSRPSGGVVGQIEKKSLVMMMIT